MPGPRSRRRPLSASPLSQRPRRSARSTRVLPAKERGICRPATASPSTVAAAAATRTGTAIINVAIRALAPSDSEYAQRILPARAGARPRYRRRRLPARRELDTATAGAYSRAKECLTPAAHTFLPWHEACYESREPVRVRARRTLPCGRSRSSAFACGLWSSCCRGERDEVAGAAEQRLSRDHFCCCIVLCSADGSASRKKIPPTDLPYFTSELT